MWWFDDWLGVARVLAVGAAAYVLLVLMLRVSGKRTLTKLNAFDLVVTVAMGSTLSSALLSKDVALAEAVAGFLVLIGGQYLVARLASRSRRFSRIVKSDPRLLFSQGRFLDAALADERVTREEVISAIRGAGIRRIEEVGAVVLETDGSLHVLPSNPQGESASALQGLQATDPTGR